jgi:hypothetical protein
MPNQAAIPAASPYVFLKMGLRELSNPAHHYSVCDSPSSRVGQGPARRAALSSVLVGQEGDENYVLARVSRSVSRLLFGHCFGAYPAPGGSSLFCFGSFPQHAKTTCRGPRTWATLRVTVSLQILFGKYAEKISPDPP